jgi:DNA-binding NtrC family response regulator
MRVAWVDDVEVIRLVAQRIVERAGGSCVGFEDHASLLASRAGPFDAAVLQPSDMVPADATRIDLQRRGVGTIILASGDSAESVARAGIDVPAFDGFLQKPFSFGDLRAALGLDTERGEVAS